MMSELKATAKQNDESKEAHGTEIQLILGRFKSSAASRREYSNAEKESRCRDADEVALTRFIIGIGIELESVVRSQRPGSIRGAIRSAQQAALQRKHSPNVQEDFHPFSQPIPPVINQKKVRSLDS
ncbi:hypothetical protein QAD02_020859 [Eretmocerus hayati]|uniref:Uncharacterized protein n=1 Tax=Eretmocerus hayati TaxID=131215 RepID=A0ACC2PPW7_9HYME|nr:hypothetical protein QAD02_020859 [Eretmocerus hayati]